MLLRDGAMNKVLVVSPFFPPFSKVGATKRIENFVRYLPAQQWEPLVLAMHWGHAELSEDAHIRMFYTRNIAYASWKAYQTADISKSVSWKSWFMKKIIGLLRAIKKYVLVPDELVLWIFWAVPRARQILKQEKPDVILVTAPPYSSLLTAVILKKILKVPLVCDVRDDWVENPLIEKDSRLLRRIEAHMERWVVRNADAIVVMTSASLGQWRRRYPGTGDKFLLIPNGYNEEEFSSIPAYAFKEFALVHVGSLELNRSPELIYRALSRIGAAEKKIHFYQYGLALRVFDDMAVRHGLAEVVHFEGFIASDDAVAREKGAALLVLLPTQNAPTAIPGKAYEYLRTGKPILLISADNATTAFMKKFPRVYHVKPDDEEGCLEAIRKVYGEKDQGKKDKPGEEIKPYERKELTKILASKLDALVTKRG